MTAHPGIAAEYRELVETYGGCVCTDISCCGDVADRDITDRGAEDGCLLCHHLDPEWPCPAEKDANYPKAVQSA